MDAPFTDLRMEYIPVRSVSNILFSTAPGDVPPDRPKQHRLVSNLVATDPETLPLQQLPRVKIITALIRHRAVPSLTWQPRYAGPPASGVNITSP